MIKLSRKIGEWIIVEDNDTGDELIRFEVVKVKPGLTSGVPYAVIGLSSARNVNFRRAELPYRRREVVDVIEDDCMSEVDDYD